MALVSAIARPRRRRARPWIVNPNRDYGPTRRICMTSEFSHRGRRHQVYGNPAQRMPHLEELMPPARGVLVEDQAWPEMRAHAGQRGDRWRLNTSRRSRATVEAGTMACLSSPAPTRPGVPGLGGSRSASPPPGQAAGAGACFVRPPGALEQPRAEIGGRFPPPIVGQHGRRGPDPGAPARAARNLGFPSLGPRSPLSGLFAASRAVDACARQTGPTARRLGRSPADDICRFNELIGVEENWHGRNDSECERRCQRIEESKGSKEVANS